MDQKTKILLTLALIFLGLGCLVIFQVQSLGKLHLVFCDVGQGDGILMITPGGKQIVVDGGPGSKIGDCLSQKMPFWDRTIEMVVLTHPERDHLEGLLEVLARYKVEMIVTTGIKNNTELFSAWQKAVDQEGAKIYTPKAGDRLVLDSTGDRTSSIEILWPTSEKLELWKLAGLSETNESSIVLRVSLGPPNPPAGGGGFCAYLTGDLPKESLQPLIDKPCQVLKVSHHGSKTGTNQEIINAVEPAVAVIQVGKNNFGHPQKEVLELLQSKGVKILRNDTNGIVEVVTDGKSYQIKTQK
jgi:competence protein ComEC